MLTLKARCLALGSDILLTFKCCLSSLFGSSEPLKSVPALVEASYELTSGNQGRNALERLNVT